MLVVTTLMLLGLLSGITASQLRGYRPGGVIIVPLFAIYTLRSFGTFPVLVLSVAGAYLSVSVIFGLLTVVSLTSVIQFDNGLLPFFTGILGGVGAYNTHVVAPAERRSAIIIATGTFVVLAAVARVFLTPLDPGILHDVQVTHLLASVLVLALAAREAHQFERVRPRDFEYVDLKADAGTTTGEQS